MSQPYTIPQHIRRCYQAANDRVVLITFVQVKKQSVTCCARLKDVTTTPDGLDLWRVELLGPGPFRGMASVHPRQTRQCSGLDGHCQCALDAGGAAAASEARCGDGGETAKGGGSC